MSSVEGPAYPNHDHCKGLYFLTGDALVLREKIISRWRKLLLQPLNGNQVKTPVLIPRARLAASGHLEEFGTQILSVDSNLNLRPETAQSIFANYPTYRKLFRGNPLVIGQVGLAFRNEKSTRTTRLRCKEFEQLQLEAFIINNDEEAAKLILKFRGLVRALMLDLGIDYTEIEIPENERPHYSRRTLDLYFKDWEIGCINDRGCHDVGNNTRVIEVSLGLTRLIKLFLNSIK